MKKILLLINPQSRQGAESYDIVETTLKDKGYDIVNSREDVKNCEFPELIYQYAKDVDLVVAGGGDGTINCCLEALVETRLPLHVIPLGTANNLARTLQIPKELEENLKILDGFKIKKIDLGIVNDLYFVNVVGIGLSTKVNHTVSKKSKLLFGPFAFVWKAFTTVWKMRPFHLGLFFDQGVHWAHSWQLTVCNGQHYGSGLVISEQAALDDQHLECLSSEMKKWWHGFAALPALLSGKHQDNENFTHIRTRELLIRTNRKMLIDVDGDIKTQTPATLKVKKEALSILVP